jgi:maleate isomerase
MSPWHERGPTPLREQAAWSPVPCALDERPWPTPSIGLIALAGDAVIEPELRVFLGSHAHLHTTRVALSSAMMPTDLTGLQDAIPVAAGLLLPGGWIDVVAFGCTSGAAALGSESVRTFIRRVRPCAEATDPLAASLAEFALRGVRSVAILSPYPDVVNARVAAYLSTHGVRVVVGATFRTAGVGRVLGRTPANLIAPSSILDAAIGIGGSTAVAVFISCTGLRCAEILAEAEKRLCKPVICSNQALATHVLRLAGAG